MKKAMVLILAAVLVLSFAVGVMAKADPHPPTHDCEIVTECNEYGCIMWKCCIDCVWDKGGYVCGDEICVPLT